MKKSKKKAGSQGKCVKEKCCEENFRRTCYRAAVIAASYQIFSLGMSTMDNPRLPADQDEGKTFIGSITSRLSSTLNDPVYGWCTCAHLGQRGPGSGCSCTGCTGCTGCTSCTGCTGCTACTGCTGFTQQQQQQQQREEEDRKARDEEERQRKIAEEKKQQEEFEKGKERALKLLKGADSDEFGLKGFDQGGDMGFKDLGDTGAKDINADPSVVDLRHLDPNKPITVDPNIPRGKERKIPVQVSEKTLNNENYKKGYEAILANDHAAAVQYFKKAQAELPDDILVKNALDLAEDLAKKQTAAYRVAEKGLVSALAGDYGAAVKHLESAINMDPKNETLRDCLKTVEQAKKEIAVIGSKPMEERAMAVANQSFGAIYRKDYHNAILILEAALAINPYDQRIQDRLDLVKKMQNEAVVSQGKKEKTAGKR